MEPRIQYAQTKDGVSIAFHMAGKGPTLVAMPWASFTHVHLEWQRPNLRRSLDRLAMRSQLVRYDGRGTGLSQRNLSGFSPGAPLLDLQAVVDRLDVEQFALYGPHYSGLTAIAYAALNPHRVSHLILRNTFARGSDFARSPQAQAFAALIDKDWEMYTENVARVLWGWSAGEEATAEASFIRQCVTQEDLMTMRQGASIVDLDLTPLLPQIAAPTLVLHTREVAVLPVDLAIDLTSRLPNARLVLTEDMHAGGQLSDEELSAIDEFLDEGAHVAGESAPASGLVTILFTDIAGSTAMRQRLGDAGAQDLLHTHNTIVRDALKAHGGSEIKHTGDGIMASFPSASRALECAIAVQQAVAAHVEQHPEAPLSVYIGLNAGEPIAEEQDLFGTAVDLARRICDQAQGGEILASDVVRQLASGKGFLFADRGDVALRGFEDPVRLYEVRWRE